MDFVRRIYDKYVGKGIWSIGILDNTIEDVVEGNPLQLKRIENPYDDRWWADPFVLDVTQDYIIILVEEVFYKETEIGHITQLKVDRSSLKVLSVETILELDTHLSFPCILRHDNKVYIYPENSKAGNLSIYEYDYQRKYINKVDIICDEQLADAIIFPYQERIYLLATKAPFFDGNRLEVYEYDLSKKKFLHNKNVCFSENIARNAGNIFEWNGKFYRPAQECNDRYGHAISIQEMSYDEEKGFSFHEIRRILPFDKKFPSGIHTLNTYGSIIVVDHYKYQYLIDPYLRSIKRFICKFFKR